MSTRRVARSDSDAVSSGRRAYGCHRSHAEDEPPVSDARSANKTT